MGYLSFSRSAGKSGSLGRLLLKRLNIISVAREIDWDPGMRNWSGIIPAE